MKKAEVVKNPMQLSLLVVQILICVAFLGGRRGKGQKTLTLNTATKNDKDDNLKLTQKTK